MADLIRYQPPTLSPRAEARSHSRALASLDHSLSLGLARIDQAADLQAAKVDAVAQVGKRALQASALLSQLECQLGQLVPSAVPRLQAIGDLTSLAMAEVVSDTSHRLSRLR